MGGSEGELTAAAPGGQVRVVNLSFTPVEGVFRAELRAWLREHVPGGAPAAPSLADEVRELRAWQRTLHGGGWVGIHWPWAYGGRGASAVEHYILQEELAAARAPEVINRIGVNLVGPTLIAHGTEEQKRRFLPPILPADELWCQLFSEPGAGSDLTALRTRAEPTTGGWLVSGQRVAQHFIEVEITRLNNWRTLSRLARREPLGPESSFVKLFWSEMSQRMHDTLMDLLGPRGLCWQAGPHAVAGGRLARSYLYYRAATLFAGTSEIQRNILAERVLGLPRAR